MLWNLMKEMDSLRRGLDRLFEEGDMEFDFPFSRVAFLPGRAAREYPLVNLSSDTHNYYIEALAPGIKIDSLNVNVVHNTLTISGEKPTIDGEVETKAFHRSERSAGKFIRTIELPEEINETKVAAEYKNGILFITLPKTEKTQPKQIKIEVS